MLAYIELYILCYFCLALFMQLAIKNLLCTKFKIAEVVLFSLVFCGLKFVQDYFAVKVIYQTIICGVYFALASILLHKTKHISKLGQVMAASLIYYLCLQGANLAITTLIMGQHTNYISNFYLVCQIGLNLIVYSLVTLLIYIFKTQSNIKLTHSCTLKIADKAIPISGYLDTGNKLVDTLSGLPVVIVNICAIKKFISSQMYADILFATNASSKFLQIHKLKYATVSGTSFMTVFTPKLFLVGGKQVKVAVGITSQNSNECDALLNLACAL